MTYRGRFAPSPTGPAHFGTLVAAVGSWLCARAQHGRWIVRIEDLDPPREVPGASADILATLAAFGMSSDESVWYQSTRTAAYDVAFAQLQTAGDVFPCWCSRSDLEGQGGGMHHWPCVAPARPDRAPAWRVRVPDLVVTFDDLLLGPQQQNLRDAVGDFVIKRVEGWYAYQFAVVVDDAAQQISEVVRGADLLDSTPRQIYLQRLLGYATPGYAHLPLALDGQGRKLSKHDSARAVDRDNPLPALREALRFLGFVPDDSVLQPAHLLRHALRDFDLARIKKVAVLPPHNALDTSP